MATDYADIHEAITKLEEANTEYPFGVIGVVSGYVFRKARVVIGILSNPRRSP